MMIFTKDEFLSEFEHYKNFLVMVDKAISHGNDRWNAFHEVLDDSNEFRIFEHDDCLTVTVRDNDEMYEYDLNLNTMFEDDEYNAIYTTLQTKVVICVSVYHKRVNNLRKYNEQFEQFKELNNTFGVDGSLYDVCKHEDTIKRFYFNI
jgi:uncharacterized NAD-dependent epimerase/dehydratase family protein